MGEIGSRLLVAGLAFGILILLNCLSWWKRLGYRWVAIVRQSVWNNQKVIFKGRYFDIPLIHQSKMIDMSVKRIECEAVGFESLRCRDYMKADLTIVFFVRMPNKADSVLLALETFGSHCECEPGGYFKDSDLEIAKVFRPIFDQKIKQVVSSFDFVDLYQERDEMKRHVQSAIDEHELFGYIVEDLAVDRCEQTPLDFFDPKDKLDARGIAAIEECIAKQNIEIEKLIAEEEGREIEG